MLASQSVILNSLMDIWGISFTLYMYCGGERYLNLVISPSKLLRLRLLDNLEMSLTNLGLSYRHAKKVIVTEYALLFIFTCISMFISFTTFALFPNAMRIFSHLLSLLLVRKFLPDWEEMTDLHLLYVAIAVTYTIVGVWRAVAQRKETDMLADVIVGNGGRRTSFGFFLSVFVAIFFISLFHLNLRLLNFRETRILPLSLYFIFVVSQLATVKYLTRCLYCLFFLRSRIPGFRSVSFLELIPLTFTACLAGMLRPLNLVGISIGKYLSFVGFDQTTLPLLTILDNNRLKLYYAAVYSQPYFRASVESRKLLWRGELRDKMIRHRLFEPFFPLGLASFLAFVSIFSGIIDFFRIYDVLIIQATYFLFTVEIFNTFAIVDVLAPYYNPASGDFTRCPSSSETSNTKSPNERFETKYSPQVALLQSTTDFEHYERHCRNRCDGEIKN